MTTSKDYVKIADKYKNKISEFAIKLEIKKEQDFEKLLYDQIKKIQHKCEYFYLDILCLFLLHYHLGLQVT